MSVGTELEKPPESEIAPSLSQRLTTELRNRLGHSAVHGALAVVDQTLVSATSFLTSVIVGRACGPLELGDYTLGFTLYVVACCVLRALISMPYTVNSQQLHGEDQRAFAGSTLAHFGIFAVLWVVVLGSVSGAFALGFGPSDLAALVGILAIAYPLAFLVEFARRFALAKLEMSTVLALDAAMAFLQVGGLLLLAWLGWLSAVAAYVAVGVGAALAGLTWLAASRSMFLIRPAQVVADFWQNWRCGRWLLFSNLSLAARASAVLWVIALELDATVTGIFVACDTLIRLSSPLPVAAANVLFPSAARAFAQGDVALVRRLVKRSTLTVVLATAPFFLMFVLVGGLVLTLIYGDGFAGYGLVVGLLAFTGITDAIDTGASNGLFAIDKPNVHFAALMLGTVTTLVLASVLMPSWGISGAAVGAVLGRTLTAIVQWVAFFRMTARDERQVSS